MRCGQIWPPGIEIFTGVPARIFAGFLAGSSLPADAFLEPDTLLRPNFFIALQQCLNMLF